MKNGPKLLKMPILSNLEKTWRTSLAQDLFGSVRLLGSESTTYTWKLPTILPASLHNHDFLQYMQFTMATFFQSTALHVRNDVAHYTDE